jgi:hypothetical protein
MRSRGLVSSMYRAARLANDVSALASGNPNRIARRLETRSSAGPWLEVVSGASSGAGSAMAELTWRAALARYRLSRQLETRARQAPFSVTTAGEALIITPGTGRPRRLTGDQFERSLPLIDRAGRGQLVEAILNSSYIEAIVDDLRRA